MYFNVISLSTLSKWMLLLYLGRSNLANCVLQKRKKKIDNPVALTTTAKEIQITRKDRALGSR